jgi:hypothetical protein
MQNAKPEELREETVVVLQAKIGEPQLHQLFPVKLEELDPLAEPEPSVGALVRLNSGDLIVVTYGRETDTLSLQMPESEPAARILAAFFEEVPLWRENIIWSVDTADGMLKRGSVSEAAK